jgi:hypothetical protein
MSKVIERDLYHAARTPKKSSKTACSFTTKEAAGANAPAASFIYQAAKRLLRRTRAS